MKGGVCGDGARVPGLGDREGALGASRKSSERRSHTKKSRLTQSHLPPLLVPQPSLRPPIMATGNRKERRAAAKQNGNANGAFRPTTEIDEAGVEMILKHPDTSGPKGKTLFDRAEERQRELDIQAGKIPANSGSTLAGEEDPIGPLGDAILYSISLTMLHITLDVIVYSQYREDIIWSEIFKRAATAMPVFIVIVYLLHVDTVKRFPTLRNSFFLVVSVVAGCYMVYSGNKHGYFYVLKSAPPIGAMWVWSVIEADLAYAVSSCLAVVAYLWWNGFDAF